MFFYFFRGFATGARFVKLLPNAGTCSPISAVPDTSTIVEKGMGLDYKSVFKLIATKPAPDPHRLAL